MASRDIIDIFEECSRRMAAGQSVDECLRMYPEYAARLRPLLETQQRLSGVQIAPAEIQADAAVVWQRIEQELARQPARPRSTYPRLLLVAVLLLALISIAAVFVAWWNQPSNTMFITPLEESATPTVTFTMTTTPSVTASPTVTPTVSPTLTPTATSSMTPTATETITPSSTSSLTPTTTTSPTTTTTPSPTVTLTLSPTFAPGCGAPLTAEAAIDRVLEVYPNTTVTSVRQMIKFGDTLVWEVQTSHRIEVNIDVACGHILTIERETAATPTISGNQNNAVSPDGFTPPSTNDDGGESNDNVDDSSNRNDNDDDDDDRSNSNSNDDDDD